MQIRRKRLELVQVARGFSEFSSGALHFIEDYKLFVILDL